MDFKSKNQERGKSLKAETCSQMEASQKMKGM